MAKPASSAASALVYVDHPEIRETFVDGLERMTLDGGALRLEFVVNRLDGMAAGQQRSGKRHTACRLVLPMSALPGFVTQMTNLADMLVKQGVLQRNVAPPSAPSEGKKD